MADLKISDMIEMQRLLWEAHKEKWSPIEPKYARDSLLWMIEEMGEVIAIVKKRGESAIMEDEHLRHEFVTELADVMMYFNDVLLRYGVTPQEISQAYLDKHGKNVARDFTGEHANFKKSDEKAR